MANQVDHHNVVFVLEAKKLCFMGVEKDNKSFFGS